jgi:hypothetical protein
LGGILDFEDLFKVSVWNVALWSGPTGSFDNVNGTASFTVPSVQVANGIYVGGPDPDLFNFPALTDVDFLGVYENANSASFPVLLRVNNYFQCRCYGNMSATRFPMLKNVTRVGLYAGYYSYNVPSTTYDLNFPAVEYIQTIDQSGSSSQKSNLGVFMAPNLINLTNGIALDGDGMGGFEFPKLVNLPSFRMTYARNLRVLDFRSVEVIHGEFFVLYYEYGSISLTASFNFTSLRQVKGHFTFPCDQYRFGDCRSYSYSSSDPQITADLVLPNLESVEGNMELGGLR